MTIEEIRARALQTIESQIGARQVKRFLKVKARETRRALALAKEMRWEVEIKPRTTL